MAGLTTYQCILCGLEAKEKPPRHCPNCGAGASRFRLLVPAGPTPKILSSAPQSVEPIGGGLANGAGKPLPVPSSAN